MSESGREPQSLPYIPESLFSPIAEAQFAAIPYIVLHFFQQEAHADDLPPMRE
jgi:hypothetical protein